MHTMLKAEIMRKQPKVPELVENAAASTITKSSDYHQVPYTAGGMSP